MIVGLVAVALSWPSVGSPVDYVLALLAWPAGIETEYAAGYSELGFRRIQPGMTRAEVVRLVGDPLGEQRWDYNEGREHVTMASYSRSASDGHHWMRRVHYERDIVVGVRAEFWID